MLPPLRQKLRRAELLSQLALRVRKPQPMSLSLKQGISLSLTAIIEARRLSLKNTARAPQSVSSELIGTNLTTVKEGEASQAIAANSIVAETVEVNAANIAVNTANIAGNTLAIASNTTAIQANSSAIQANTTAINEIRNGSAAIASLPDLYLGSDETWSIAGGLALYDDGFGGQVTRPHWRVGNTSIE